MTDDRPSRLRRLTLLPLLAAAGLFGLFAIIFWQGRDPAIIPSALIGKPAPAGDLPALAGLTANGKPVPGILAGDFRGQTVTVVNVFASWCAPCRLEHPILMKLAAEGDVRVVGLNYKDKASDALRFLNGLGNPYQAVGADERGRAAIEWGVYGVPETFVIAANGTVTDKIVGPLSDEVLQMILKPAIAKAKVLKP